MKLKQTIVAATFVSLFAFGTSTVVASEDDEARGGLTVNQMAYFGCMFKCGNICGPEEPPDDTMNRVNQCDKKCRTLL